MAMTDAPSPVLGESPEVWQAQWNEESFAPERLSQLVAELTPSEEIRAGRTLGVHIVDGADPHSDLGRFVELTMFEKRFGNDIEKMREMYQAYDSVSTFLMVLDYEAQEPAAVIRIVKPIGENLITLDEIVKEGSPWAAGPEDSIEARKAEMGYEAGHTVDITTMAVMPNYQSAHSRDGASGSLYSTCVRWSLANGYNHWATIVDERIYTMMQGWGEPFTPFEGTDFVPFEGSKASRPVHTELHSGLEKVKAFDQGVYDLYTKGAGLDLQYVLPEIA